MNGVDGGAPNTQLLVIAQAIAQAINKLNTLVADINTAVVAGFFQGYPSGSTPITAASGSVSNSNAVATLVSVAGKTNYITGFHITSGGSTTAALVSATVAGVATGTMTYVYGTVAGATARNADLVVTFPIPIPASAAHTNIVVTLPALGSGNTAAAVVAYGFRL